MLAGYLLLSLLLSVIGLLCWLMSLDAEATQRWKTSKVLTATLALGVLVLGAFGLMSIGMKLVFGADVMSVFLSSGG